ncbi:flagellar biosynthetic protein FliO [Planctomycetota bacterium]
MKPVILPCVCALLWFGLTVQGADSVVDANRVSPTADVGSTFLEGREGILSHDGSSMNGEIILKTLGALAVVIVLGLLVVFVSKHWLPKIGQVSGKEIRILESTGLGPRKTLHLIQVGSQRLLIGVTVDRIVKLADVPGDFESLVQSQLADVED